MRSKREANKWAIEEGWVEENLPVVGELKNCRQLSKGEWEGTDVDGTIYRVKGKMPKHLIAPLRRLVSFRKSWGYTAAGLIRPDQGSGVITLKSAARSSRLGKALARTRRRNPPSGSRTGLEMRCARHAHSPRIQIAISSDHARA
jgi:hypothetical protein